MYTIHVLNRADLIVGNSSAFDDISKCGGGAKQKVGIASSSFDFINKRESSRCFARGFETSREESRLEPVAENQTRSRLHHVSRVSRFEPRPARPVVFLASRLCCGSPSIPHHHHVP